MKMKFRCQSFLILPLFIGLLLGTVAGCKRNENSTPVQDKGPVTQSPQQQSDLNRASAMIFEHDPAKRPLVLSKPASNRRDWALQALKQGYHDSGQTNAQWDANVQSAFEAFADFSRLSRTNWSKLEKTLAAVPASCTDPMIQYMRARYDTKVQTEAQAATEFIKAHESILQSSYHPVFKFYAGLRAMQTARAADEGGNRGYGIERTTGSVEDLARDTNAPVDEVFEPARLWLEHSHSTKWIQIVTANLEPILKTNWGTTEQWYRFEGNAEVNRAWGEGGGGWTSSATNKGWAGFAEHLDKAEQSLGKAWEMNSNNAQTAYLMMRVELGQGKGLSRMQLWFDRVMALDPNSYDAAKLMSFYLEPRWYGSDAKSLEFARSCVASDKWGGRVPIVLAELHRSLAMYSQMSNSPAYWHQPQVWSDIKSSYEKLLALNNADTAGWRHSYAVDAYDCGQYSAFLEQIKLFTEGTNYSYFGGPENFQQMVQKASGAAK